MENGLLLLFLSQWEKVDYFDNKIICDLIEAKHQGIIALLVSCTMPLCLELATMTNIKCGCCLF